MNFLKEEQWISPNKVYLYKRLQNYNKTNLMRLLNSEKIISKKN